MKQYLRNTNGIGNGKREKHDCSIPHPDSNDYIDFLCTPLRCYSIKLIPITAQTSLTLMLHRLTKGGYLIVAYYSHQIIVNSMQMMMLMVENMTCLLGMPANDETIAQCHGARPDCVQSPIFGQDKAKIHHGGRMPYSSDLAIFGGRPCCVCLFVVVGTVN